MQHRFIDYQYKAKEDIYNIWIGQDLLNDLTKNLFVHSLLACSFTWFESSLKLMQSL